MADLNSTVWIIGLNESGPKAPTKEAEMISLD
jgi:hypothetical protein